MAESGQIRKHKAGVINPLPWTISGYAMDAKSISLLGLD
jgi:hypothetical protein